MEGVGRAIVIQMNSGLNLFMLKKKTLGSNQDKLKLRENAHDVVHLTWHERERERERGKPVRYTAGNSSPLFASVNSLSF